MQGGDPPKGARAMYDIAMMDKPPPRVVLGSDACEYNSSLPSCRLLTSHFFAR